MLAKQRFSRSVIIMSEIKFKKSFIGPFVSNINGLIGGQHDPKEPLVFEAFVGAYADAGGDESYVAAILDMASKPASSRQIHETLGNIELRDKVVGGIAAVLALSEEKSQEDPLPYVRQATHIVDIVPAQQKAPLRLDTTIPEPKLADGPWWTRANCRGIDTEQFYSENVNSSRSVRLVCGQCAVREICLMDALERNEPYGIWGGLTPKERHSLSKRRRHAV